MSGIIQEIYNRPIDCCEKRAKKDFKRWFDNWRLLHPNRRVVCEEHPVRGVGEPHITFKVTISYRENEG